MQNELKIKNDQIQYQIDLINDLRQKMIELEETNKKIEEIVIKLRIDKS
jgi:hypothetical protein